MPIETLSNTDRLDYWLRYKNKSRLNKFDDETILELKRLRDFALDVMDPEQNDNFKNPRHLNENDSRTFLKAAQEFYHGIESFVFTKQLSFEKLTSEDITRLNNLLIDSEIFHQASIVQLLLEERSLDKENKPMRECVVCQENWIKLLEEKDDDHDRENECCVYRSCGHTICKACYQDFCFAEDEGLAQGSSTRCPTCRSDDEVGPEMINFFKHLDQEGKGREKKIYL